MATIKDVAKMAGVAVSTASYALNGSTKISESTREKVIKTAKQLNYKKNGFASDLKKRSTKTIVLILSDLSGPYYSELIQGVQDMALEHGYDLIACSSVGGGESTGIKFLKEHRVDGAIVMSNSIPGNILQETVRDGFPIVVFDRLIKNDHLINVTVDNKQGGYDATEHLINLGHRDIGFIGGPVKTVDSQDRFSGYLEALNDNQLDFRQEWCLHGNFTRKSGFEVTETLISSQNKLPSALFYANDEMAIGALQALKKHNIHVPEQLSIIGFDDIELAELVNPPLTTIRQPKYEVGSLCAKRLIERLKGGQVTQNTKLSTKIIVRSSTRTHPNP